MPASISETPEFMWPFLNMMGEIGFSRMFEDYDCQRKILCEMALLSDNSNTAQGRSKKRALGCVIWRPGIPWPRSNPRNIGPAFLTKPLQRLIQHVVAAMPETLVAEKSLGLQDVREGSCERIECENSVAGTKNNSKEFNP